MDKMKFSRLALALLVCGCTAQQPAHTASTPASTSAASTPDATAVTGSPAPVASDTPTGSPLGDPELPADAPEYLVPLPAFLFEEKDRYEWWSATGISDNGLRVFVSALPAAEIEARAAAYLPGAENKRTSSFPGATFVDVQGSRVAAYSEDGSYGVGMMISPISPTPPAAWATMLFPPIDWARHAELLKDKASIVVVASGYGTAGVFHDKASAGGSAAPAASATPTASTTPPPSTP